MLEGIKKALNLSKVEEEHVVGVHSSGSPMYLDIFVPEYNLAVEYQGMIAILGLLADSPFLKANITTRMSWRFKYPPRQWR